MPCERMLLHSVSGTGSSVAQVERCALSWRIGVASNQACVAQSSRTSKTVSRETANAAEEAGMCLEAQIATTRVNAGETTGIAVSRPASRSCLSGITGSKVWPSPASKVVRKMLIELMSAMTLGGGWPPRRAAASMIGRTPCGSAGRIKGSDNAFFSEMDFGGRRQLGSTGAMRQSRSVRIALRERFARRVVDGIASFTSH